MYRRRHCADHGAAAVEAALVITFVLLPVIFGVISYGYMLSFRQSVSLAANEGVRAGAVAPAATTPDRQAIAFDAIANAMGAECNVDHLVCETATPDDCATCFSVTVRYNYLADDTKPNFPGMGIVVPEQLTYTAVSETTQ